MGLGPSTVVAVVVVAGLVVVVPAVVVVAGVLVVAATAVVVVLCLVVLVVVGYPRLSSAVGASDGDGAAVDATPAVLSSPSSSWALTP